MWTSGRSGDLRSGVAAAGWRHQGDLGIKGREALRQQADAVYHGLYCVVAGSQPHRDHVDLRDFLRAHPGQAARYADLKHRLAGLLAADAWRTAMARPR